jgi:hypothetical protein
MSQAKGNPGTNRDNAPPGNTPLGLLIVTVISPGDLISSYIKNWLSVQGDKTLYTQFLSSAAHMICLAAQA